MKHIYTLLNEITTNLSSYQKEPLTDSEKAKLLAFTKQISGRPNQTLVSEKRPYNIFAKRRRMSLAACAAFFIILLGSTVFQNQAQAAMRTLSLQIGYFLGIDRNLEDYTTVIHSSYTNKGYTITLNEVILNQNQLVVSSTIHSENPLEMSHASAEVYMNGKPVSIAAGGGSRQVDEHTVESVISYELEKFDSSRLLDFDIIYTEIGIDEGSITGTWKFSFSAAGDKLKKDTVTIPIQADFTLPDGMNIRLKEYTANSLGERIYFEYEGDTPLNYDLQIMVTDDFGKETEFYLSYVNANNQEGRFNRSELEPEISSDTATLTLVPYAVAFPKESGRLSNDFKQTGSPIIIQLNLP